ncbi:unnamed protein product, partial [marine sediment metagenome]
MNLLDITKLEIRPVRRQDHQKISLFFKTNNISQITRHFTPFQLNDKSARYITRTDHKDPYYLALTQTQVIGLSMLRGWDEGFSTPSIGILIDYRYHNKGIGRKLMNYT